MAFRAIFGDLDDVLSSVIRLSIAFGSFALELADLMPWITVSRVDISQIQPVLWNLTLREHTHANSEGITDCGFILRVS